MGFPALCPGVPETKKKKKKKKKKKINLKSPPPPPTITRDVDFFNDVLNTCQTYWIARVKSTATCLAVRVLFYVPCCRHHSLCYTSSVAKKSPMGPPRWFDLTTHRTMSKTFLPWSYISLLDEVDQ